MSNLDTIINLRTMNDCTKLAYVKEVTSSLFHNIVCVCLSHDGPPELEVSTTPCWYGRMLERPRGRPGRPGHPKT